MDVLYFTDTDCFSFVAALQCTVLQLPWGHYCNIAMLAGIWTCEIIHAWVCQWARLHVSIRLWPAAETLKQAKLPAFRSSQLNLHTDFLPESIRFYFLPDNWDIVLFIALQCTQAQHLSAWNSYEFILGPQMLYSWYEPRCWHLRQQICSSQLSITHSSISALCCCCYRG